MLKNIIHFQIYMLILWQTQATPANLIMKTYKNTNYEIAHPIRERSAEPGVPCKTHNEIGKLNNTNGQLFDFLFLYADPKEQQWYRMQLPTNPIPIQTAPKQKIPCSTEAQRHESQTIENLLNWLNKREMQELNALYQDLTKEPEPVTKTNPPINPQANPQANPPVNPSANSAAPPKNVEYEKYCQQLHGNNNFENPANEKNGFNGELPDNSGNVQIIPNEKITCNDTEKPTQIKNENMVISSNTQLDQSLIERVIEMVNNFESK